MHGCMAQKYVPKINRPQINSCPCKRFRKVESKLISIHFQMEELNARAEATFHFDHAASSHCFSHFCMRWWCYQWNEKPIIISWISLWINLTCGHLILPYDSETSPSVWIFTFRFDFCVYVINRCTPTIEKDWPRKRNILFPWVLLKCNLCIRKQKNFEWNRFQTLLTEYTEKLLRKNHRQTQIAEYKMSLTMVMQGFKTKNIIVIIFHLILISNWTNFVASLEMVACAKQAMRTKLL